MSFTSSASPPSSSPPRPGTVYLVGAGPGDPGLLTLRARDLLAGASEVYYDYLVSAGVLAHCPPDARLINVGKVGHGPQTAQHAIERLLVAAAKAGHRVVRLKGGDPLVFGRGAEEAMALRAAGVPFEIVPGVSSAMAVPAYAGIPITARGHASSVAIVTGHSTTGRPAAMPKADTTVVLMGIANCEAVRDQLLVAGHASDTPVAAIEWGTCAAERAVIGTLGELPALVARERLGAPSILVIGEVVRLREQLEWRRSSVLGGHDDPTFVLVHSSNPTVL